MNDAQNNRRGRVIPRWLEYPKALKGGELVIPRKTPFEVNDRTKNTIDKEYQEFKLTPSLEIACSLLGAAIVVGDRTLAEEMARFIKEKKGIDKAFLALADKILNRGSTAEVAVETNLHIAQTKSWINKFPRNAIAWIELARLYTIKGQKHKAKRAVLVALGLAPFDRYIVRCAVRFFLHIGDNDSAWHYIQRASRQGFDPWLKAIEINVSLISGKSTPSLKGYLPKDHTDVNVFHYSELFESTGLLELDAGNQSKAKKQFRKAWIDPSESVITHAEWIIRNKLPGLRKTTSLNFGKSMEALTWIHYFDLKVDKSLETVKEWELEEPYSKYPFIVGSSIASNIGRPDEGAEIAQRGLTSNPDDIMLNNNHCYALLRAGRVREAENLIGKIKAGINSEYGIYCLATRGLFEFKKNNIHIGRRLYFEVIEKCQREHNHDLHAKAYLSLALTEIEASTPEAKETIEKAIAASNKISSPDITLLRQQVLKIWRKKKNFKA